MPYHHQLSSPHGIGVGICWGTSTFVWHCALAGNTAVKSGDWPRSREKVIFSIDRVKVAKTAEGKEGRKEFDRPTDRYRQCKRNSSTLNLGIRVAIQLAFWPPKSWP